MVDRTIGFRRALELKLFEDQKDSIKLKRRSSPAVVDKEMQENIGHHQVEG